MPRTKDMKVVSTKWLDNNKGDEKNPDLRARLVAREINTHKRLDLFATTPPLESLRAVLSILASNQGNEQAKDNFILMSNDIKRAYFYAPAQRPVFITIP